MQSGNMGPPHYTLPGVMHYLQSEFSRNERDRIAWELEKYEMKARVAQLEGENRDLRYKLSKFTNSNDPITPNEVSVDPDTLVQSKIAIQENVKEIIYLLKNSKIDSANNAVHIDSENNLHRLQQLNVANPSPISYSEPVPVVPSPFCRFQEMKKVEAATEGAIMNFKTSLSGQMISNATDNSVELFALENESIVSKKVFNNFAPDTLSCFVTDKFVLALQKDSLQISSLKVDRPINTIRFEQNLGNSFDVFRVISAVFSNDRLLIYSSNNTLKLSPKLDLKKTTSIQEFTSIVSESFILDAVILGKEEKILTLESKPLSLLLYDFEGNLTSKIKLPKLSKENDTEVIEFQDNYIILDDTTNDAIIQIGKMLFQYSCKEGTVQFQNSLDYIPRVIAFNFKEDLLIVSKLNFVLMRKWSDFETLSKTWVSSQTVTRLQLMKSDDPKSLFIIATNSVNNEILYTKISKY